MYGGEEGTHNDESGRQKGEDGKRNACVLCHCCELVVVGVVGCGGGYNVW